MTAAQRKAISRRLERAVTRKRVLFDQWHVLNQKCTLERAAKAGLGNREAQREAEQLRRAARRLEMQGEKVRRLIAQTEAAIAQAHLNRCQAPTGVNFDLRSER